MARPIVHIGFHKTATSWFQASVYPNVISHRLIDRDLVRGLFVDGDAFHFDVERARAAFGEAAGALPPLICEEELSGVLHIGAASTYIAKEVAARLQATLPDAQIVVFVRAQLDAAASWYMQYLKEGGTASARRYLLPDEYVFPGRFMHFKQARFDFSQLDYSGLIRRYDELFGLQNVHVFAFEDLVRDRAGLLAQMQQRLGFELGPAEVSGGSVNSSFRRGLIPVARLLNLFSARQVANKRTLVHVPFANVASRAVLGKLNAAPVFGGKATAKSVIDAAMAAWIERRFEQSNRWLEERMGRDLKSLGYGVGSTEPVAAPQRSSLLRWMRK
ncbi:hypothetical protein [Sphingomonas sp.]|uniref:hypothetical protein n=1 Tax=Sphingomonas sp. TaxID=28214 RepID=UPI0025E0D887|nr:hypothetical protein [Sphingomonas sp.]MBV9527816.1 hypothetical protein [Sphingomonas sp.]